MALNPELQVRRRMAKTCFVQIILTVPVCLLLAIFGEDDMVSRLMQMSGIIMLILGCQTALVTGYGATVHLQQQSEKKNVD